MTAVIEVAELGRKFGKVNAVADVTFSIEENSICGLLGRNGAGKTTLMRLITGQEFASTGDIRVFGESPVENAHVLASAFEEHRRSANRYSSVVPIRKSPSHRT